jgi:hypothetical protein
VVRARSTRRALDADAALLVGRSRSVVLDGLAGEVAGVTRRHAAAALVPAAVLGAGADAIEILRHDLVAEIALGLLIALAFELYVGYAELLVAADREARRPSVPQLLRRAAVDTPALLVASVVAVSVPLAASALLVIPGLWLLTRWSLFAPAIVHEGLGPAAALRRAATLARGAFWAVALTVTMSLLVEHAVIHATALTAEPVLGSHVLALATAALATMAVSPPAAFTISVVYERLSDAKRGTHP